MTSTKKTTLRRRDFLRQSLATAAALGTGRVLGTASAQGLDKNKKVIIIGLDGMDPRLSERLMAQGGMPNFARLKQAGGYRVLGTSVPPQSPVAWANFINGAGPGSHGIFDFIHRDPARQALPFLSIATTQKGTGYWEMGKHKMQATFWPFSHQPATTTLLRQGTPFWDILDEAGIESTFYNLPSNYPPSASKHGHHRCLSGLGTPDLLGTNGTYQHFAENGPILPQDEPGGKRSRLVFTHETARAQLVGPRNDLLIEPEPILIPFSVHRDRDARAVVIDIQKERILLKEGQWSPWIKLDFELSTPAVTPNKHIHGTCRFYLREVSPTFRLYVSPINSDPTDSALPITEPPSFSKQMASRLGLFGTTGFQEDHKALSNGLFTDEEFRIQAGNVLEERLRLLNFALETHRAGVLFFYCSSTDMQSHMFWWDSDQPHPIRSPEEAQRYFGHIQGLYRRFDGVIGDILTRYGDEATVMVMSDHGFANFTRQFNLNTWLRTNGYLSPGDATSVLADVDWSRTRAYGMGLNGLYLNLKGRERDGIVTPGAEQDRLLTELCDKLEALRDSDGRRVIRKVHRTDEVYTGTATALAPDLIVGYCRDYRASWTTCLGEMTPEVLMDNVSPWCADHCADVSEVPGVLFANRPIAANDPALIDMAPTVLRAFGLPIPDTMQGKNIFT